MKHPSTRGEIWLACLQQENGPETECDCPVVIVSSPAFDKTPVRIIVPLSKWQPEFANRMDKFPIAESERNGLDAKAVAEFLQVTSVSTERLVKKKGLLDAEQVEDIVAGIVIAIDYGP